MGELYGIELVIVLVFLIAIIFFWRYLSKRPKAKKAPPKKKRTKR